MTNLDLAVERVRAQTERDGQPDDFVWGAAGIAQVINRTERQAVYLLQTGALPAKKIGKLWVARRSALQNFLSAV